MINMLAPVSIILCTYQSERYEDFVEAVNSLNAQSCDNEKLEIVVVVDGNRELYERILKSGIEEADKVEVKVILNEENLGLSESRNRGIKEARGNIIAFFDDDAVADMNWLEELVLMYEEHDAIAAGGKILPKWVTKKPKYLPEEFYWLIGATHNGFPEEMTEVLKALDGFRSEMGVKGRGLLQGEETELCERMSNKFEKGVIYNPEAIVYH